jgi:Uma2 family endonuclease
LPSAGCERHPRGADQAGLPGRLPCHRHRSDFAGNTPRELAIKTAIYFEFGALEVWHFYPDERHVVVHGAGAEPVTIHDFVTTPLLPGFALDLQEILSV